MLYMVIEKFYTDKIKTLYQRFNEKGRMLPEGVQFVNSWISEDVSVCYQLMEANTLDQLMEWVHRWDDLADFEVVPLITSAQAKAKVLS